MMAAARDLQFELAARIRGEIADLKKELPARHGRRGPQRPTGRA